MGLGFRDQIFLFDWIRSSPSNGPVSVELWSEDEKKIKTLFSGEEAIGEHSHHFPAPSRGKPTPFRGKPDASNLTGAYYLQVCHDGIVETRLMRLPFEAPRATLIG